MSSITTPAEGGRVWKPKPKKATPTPRPPRPTQAIPAARPTQRTQAKPTQQTQIIEKVPSNGYYALIVTLVTIVTAAALTSVGILMPVYVHGRTDESLLLEYHALNEYNVAPEIKAWIPEALQQPAATIANINLPSIKEGTQGTVLLTNGETIPFTLHNEDDVRFTIDKG